MATVTTAMSEGNSPPRLLFGLFTILFKFLLLYRAFCGPGSSVGIATDYGLDGPG